MNNFTYLADNARTWLPTLKHPGSTHGHYKMCRSAFHSFSLDASSLAIDLVSMLKISLTESEKDEHAALFNAFQEPETGFYHEPFLSELANSTIDRVIEMSGTYLAFQVCGTLEAIDRLPKYPFRFYEFTLKSGAITQYIDERFPWSWSPWGAGGWIDSLATMLRMNIKMGYQEYQEPLDELLSWLSQHQNPETGLWGNPDSKQGTTGLVNGGYHLLRGTFFQLGLAPSYPDKIIDSCLSMYYENDYFRPGQGEGCHDLDLFDLLIQTTTYCETYRQDEIAAICQERLTEIVGFQNEDGAFSFFPHRAQDEHNYYQVSPGKSESDLQGTVFYLHTIRRISEYLGLTFDIKRSRTHGYQ